MKSAKYVVLPVVIFMLLFSMAMNVSAQTTPPLPSSFYGEIHVTDNPLVVGSVISIYVPGYVDPVVTTTARQDGSNLVYNVNVPGYQAGPPVVPGGNQGDPVTFMSGGRVLAVGTWASGPNVRVNFHPPAASTGGPYAVQSGHAVTLNGSAVDWLGSDTRAYAWDLDADGEYDDSTSASPSFTPTSLGNHPIAVRVTDGQGGQGFASSYVTAVDIGGLTGTDYDGAPHGVTVAGVEAPLTYTVTYDGSPTQPTNAYTYSVVVTISNGASITVPMVIAPALASVTIDAKTKTYGDIDPTLTGTLSGFVPADNVTAVYSRVAGDDVGAYQISATLSATGLLSNYMVSTTPASLSITQRPASVTPADASKVYGQNDPALTGTLSGFLPADGVTATYSREAGEDAGTYDITATLSATGLLTNYAITSNTGEFTISPLGVTITPNAGQSKVYGNADPELLYASSVTGLTFTGALGRAQGENVGPYAINLGTLSAGGNYTLTVAAANFNITARPITVTADAKTKVYGDSDPILSYAYTGTLAFDDAFSGALTRVAGEDVGLRAIQQGTLAVNANYAITYVGANLEITHRLVTITADAKTKVFGADDPALTYQITNGTLRAGDSVTGALSRVAGENAGSYAIQQGTLALNANYTLTYVGANLTINPLGVTITPTAGQSKVYGNSEPALTYDSSVTGLTFTGALGRAEGENVGPYAINLGTLSAGGNYTLTVEEANFSITARPITVTADAKTKVYGDSDPILTYAYTGTLAFDDEFSGSLSRAEGEDVGSYAIQQNTLGVNANYAITYNGASLEITHRPVTVTADAQTKVFGADDPALTYQVTSGTLREGDSFTGALSRVTGENVGPYAIQQNTLALNANYTLTYVGANLTITPLGVTITPTAGQSKVYGNSEPALTYDSSVTGLTFTGALSRAEGENVGPYAINLGTLSAGGNYTLTVAAANFNITPRAITVTADNKNKVFGAGDPALTYTVASPGLAFTDSLSGSLERVAGEAVGTYAINQGTLAASSNYIMTFVPGVFTITTVEHHVSLVPGWNLVSFNLHPTSTAVADVLASVAGNFDLVYAWDASGGHSGSGNWLKYDNISGNSDSLTTLDETMGFWIHMTAADTLEISGTFATTNIQLYDNTGGWNLVAYPSAANGALPGILDNHGGSAFALIYGYVASDSVDNWKLYDKSADPYANDMTHLLPGMGYWISMTADGTWQVAY